MAIRSIEPSVTANLLGWEWAPPPLPEPSPKRQQEPKWHEPALPAPPQGMNPRTKEVLLMIGGVFALMLAFSEPGWLVVALPLFAYAVVNFQTAANDPVAPRNLAKTRDDQWFEYQEVHRAWTDAITREEQENHRRFSVAPRWYPITRIEPTRRLDVFGGHPEGWASFMHTAFAGVIPQGVPTTVLDLTRRDLVRRALWPDANPAAAPLTLTLPSQLREYDPLVGAQHPGDIAALVTSTENPNDDWARRDIEMGIFRRMADALGDNVTLPRLHAAVTSLLAPDSPMVAKELSVQERRTLLDPNAIVMLGGDSASYLGRISAALDALVRGSRPSGSKVKPPAPLPFFSADHPTVIAADPSGDPESRRRLDNVLAASLMDRIGRSDCRGHLLLVVGADRLSRPVLEGLTAGAQERGIRLVMFFEHLRGEARELLGRGVSDTIVMRLGHHDDATTAANFIGKQHRFVVSSITLTVGTQFGGSDSHGFSVTDSSSYTSAPMGPDSSTSGRSTGSNFNYGRTWAETENYGETSTRSEEFVARAEDIQRIPTTGFIYVTAVNGRQHVIFGDCHPAIAETPLVAARAIARR
jgi:hypothetical protein